ncbi:MAG: hypothetical protein V2I76_02355 [Roseobacter sp.]|nr:hypothetical protein [Roseobacter sp.]
MEKIVRRHSCAAAQRLFETMINKVSSKVTRIIRFQGIDKSLNSKWFATLLSLSSAIATMRLLRDHGGGGDRSNPDCPADGADLGNCCGHGLRGHAQRKLFL